MRKYWSYIALGVIVVATFLLRTVGQWDKVFVDGQVLFREVDPWYHMRLVDYMVSNGPSPLSWDMFAKFPMGAQVGYFPLLSWIIYFGGKAFNYEVVGALIPPILGALISIPVYLIGKEVSNSKIVGLLGALLVMVLPSSLFQRTLLGFTDHHALEAFFYSLVLLFLILSLKRSSVTYALLAGLSLGLYTSSWAGGLLLLPPILLISVSMTYINKSKDPLLLVSSIMTSAYITAIILLPKELNPKSSLVSLLIGGILLLLSGLIAKGRERKVSIILVLLGFLGGISTYIREPVFFRDNVLGVFLGGIDTGISEAQISDPGLLFNTYGMSILLSIVGLFILIRNKGSLPFIVFSIFFLVLNISQRRWGYYNAIHVGILAAYTIQYMSSRMSSKARPLGAAMLLAGVAILPTAGGFWVASGTYQIASSKNNISPEWVDSLNWMRSNLPDPFIDGTGYNTGQGTPRWGTLSWWDYGHWILRLGKQVPWSSPTQHNVIREGDFFLAQSEYDANKVIEAFNIRYVVIHREMLGGKFGSILKRSSIIPTKEPERFRSDSMLYNLWINKVDTWVLVYSNKDIRIFERKNA